MRSCLCDAPNDSATPGVAKKDKLHDPATARARVHGELSTSVLSVNNEPTAAAAIVQNETPEPGSGSLMSAIGYGS